MRYLNGIQNEGAPFPCGSLPAFIIFKHSTSFSTFLPPLTDFALIGQDWVSVRVKFGCRQRIKSASDSASSDQLRGRIPERLHLLHERHYLLELTRLGLLGLVRLADLILNARRGQSLFRGHLYSVVHQVLYSILLLSMQKFCCRISSLYKNATQFDHI